MQKYENKKTTKEGETGEETDPPPPDLFSEDLSTEYSDAFEPYDEESDRIKNIPVYRPFYESVIDKKSGRM